MCGGELIERLNQPAVPGELVVGIILGNLALTGIGAFEPLQTAPFLPIAAEIGVVLLLFQVGLESELAELLGVGASAVAVAVLGVIAPVALGYALSSVFLPGGGVWYVHVFLGATLAATSVGLTARVLKTSAGWMRPNRITRSEIPRSGGDSFHARGTDPVEIPARQVVKARIAKPLKDVVEA